MGFRLPPVNTLRLFEAAARLGSFKLAADEIHITPSAISHGIQTLENWLGTELFHRGPRGLTLTPAGEAYAPEVQAALSILATATERLPGRRATGALSVSSAPTFANRWLLPRLSRFTELYPDIRVTIDTSRHYVDFPTAGIDLAIRRGTAPKSGESWTQLVPEMVVPVCSPSLRQSISVDDEVELLGHAPLIHVTTVREDWRSWFEARGIAPPSNERAIRVDTIQLAAEGAMRGLGIAMGRKPLIDEYLVQGSLLEIAGPAIPADTSYWLVGTQLAFDRPETRLFRAWILQEIRNGVRPLAPTTAAVPRPKITPQRLGIAR